MSAAVDAERAYLSVLEALERAVNSHERVMVAATTYHNAVPERKAEAHAAFREVKRDVLRNDPAIRPLRLALEAARAEMQTIYGDIADAKPSWPSMPSEEIQ